MTDRRDAMQEDMRFRILKLLDDSAEMSQRDLAGAVGVTLYLIRKLGAGRVKANSVLDILPWSEETEAPIIQQMDIGIMPLAETPWARGNCGYKLIQYMACGLPVIASPVGVNADIVEDGVNGFLASNEAEWCAALATLLQGPDLRCRMGEAGRKKFEHYYSLQVWWPKVARLIRSVAERGNS